MFRISHLNSNTMPHLMRAAKFITLSLWEARELKCEVLISQSFEFLKYAIFFLFSSLCDMHAKRQKSV